MKLWSIFFLIKRVKDTETNKFAIKIKNSIRHPVWSWSPREFKDSVTESFSTRRNWILSAEFPLTHHVWSSNHGIDVNVVNSHGN